MIVELTPWTSPLPGFEDKHGPVFPYDPKTGKWGEEFRPGTKEYDQGVAAVNRIRHESEAIPTAIEQYAPRGLGGLPHCQIVGIPEDPVPVIVPKRIE